MIIEPLPGGERLLVKLTPIESTAGVVAAEAQGDETLVTLFEEQGRDFSEKSGIPMENLRFKDPVASRHILRTVCDAATARQINSYVIDGNMLAESSTAPQRANEPPPDYPGFLHLVK